VFEAALASWRNGKSENAPTVARAGSPARGCPASRYGARGRTSMPISRLKDPETMAGGLAIFDYSNDGNLDIFFVNGADVRTLQKSSPKYSNRLLENEGKGNFKERLCRSHTVREFAVHEVHLGAAGVRRTPMVRQ
jgi:hypothetical protein